MQCNEVVRMKKYFKRKTKDAKTRLIEDELKKIRSLHRQELVEKIGQLEKQLKRLKLDLASIEYRKAR